MMAEMCLLQQLRYRNSIYAINGVTRVLEQPLDKIPYFVKPIDEYSFMIHRSAALDSESSVNIAHPSSSPGNDSVWVMMMMVGSAGCE